MKVQGDATRDAASVVHHARQVSHSIREPLRKILEHMKAGGMTEKAEKLSNSVNPFVIVRKQIAN